MKMFASSLLTTEMLGFAIRRARLSVISAWRVARKLGLLYWRLPKFRPLPPEP